MGTKHICQMVWLMSDHYKKTNNKESKLPMVSNITNINRCLSNAQ